LNLAAAATSLRQLARNTDRPRPAHWIDYFLFSKGLYYKKVPEFVIGKLGVRSRGVRR